jgi:FKBP-type peptidyl-prolyl cis-trans isomerase FkpA
MKMPVHRLLSVAALSSLALSCTGAAAAEPVTTATGLVYQELVAGTGEQPTAADKVRVHYVGTFADGREFDSSVSRGQPAEFPLGRVIKCWTEGVQRMKVGGKARLTCPAAIAYGEKGAGGVIPPGATLYFDVELLGVTKP